MELKAFREPSVSPRNNQRNTLLHADMLRLLLQEERERSNRSGSQFSFLLFDLKNLRSNQAGRARFIRDISDRIRAIDKTGWMKEDAFGVILPYTSASGARILADQMLGGADPANQTITYTVYTYPFSVYEG